MKKFICNLICIFLAVAILMVTGGAVEGTLSLWAAIPFGAILCALTSFIYQLGSFEPQRTAVHHARPRRLAVVHNSHSHLRAA